MNESVENKETKKCPYCAETILKKAKKCRYCKKSIEMIEWIDKTAPVSGRKRLIFAGILIGAFISFVIFLAFTTPEQKNIWSKKAPELMTWNDAKEYCNDLEEDGYSDWQMPAISELRALIRNCLATETGGACQIDNKCLSSSCRVRSSCDGCSTASDGRYSKLGDIRRLWSSSEQSGYADIVWYVDFDNGRVDSGHKEYNTHYVRCVR